ncbi:hypothetical protein CF327_g3589 [Tilletia walkeri]|uniref:NTF2 domain-containing protein n=1 Tax=Tilletia walkeri TaxID=117179 RepID=A0A8X7NBY5_9BASI|nr:hypothetical protein CF327_g3589 [Tilletia walkeri]KAE8271096.1 hypothetical protein A4X09_0g1257 [Tilletia walkeri]
MAAFVNPQQALGAGQPGLPTAAHNNTAGMISLSPPTDRDLISFCTKSAETFVSAYYAATDSPNRVRLLPNLYLPTASIVWNGTPVPAASAADASAQLANGGGAAEKSVGGENGGFAALLAVMPGSKHEVASFDAHPIGWGTGPDGIPALRSILINVSGTVQHHIPAAAIPPSNAPKSASTTTTVSAEAMMALPRVYSQAFVLVDGSAVGTDGGVRVLEERNARVETGQAAAGPSSGAGTGPTQKVTRTARWLVQSDSFRFVG